MNQLTLTLQQLVMVLEESKRSLDQKVQLRTNQLKQQSSEMESILASMQEGLLVVDDQGQIRRVNQKLVELLSCDSADHLYGEKIDRLFTTTAEAAHTTLSIKQFIAEAHSHPDTVDAQHSPLSTERKLKSCNGEEIPVQISGALLQTIDEHHHVDGAVLIAHDLRERIEAEQERNRQANQLSYQEGLAEMSSNVLHNIGNAIAGLNGRAEIIHSTLSPLQQIQQQLQQASKLEDLPLLQDGLQQLSTILQTLQQEKLAPSCEALIQGIRHISDTITIQQQMAFGRPSINSRFSLKDAINKIISLHKQSNQKLHIETQLRIDPSLDEVTLPQNQFMQMIDNLMKNSREAIAERQQQDTSTHHSITLQLDTLPEKRFLLKVTDTGVGISKHDQKQIFQRNMTTKPDGSGIGLHSVSNFIGSLQGTIQATSSGKNQGSCFTIELPQDGSSIREHVS